MGSFKKFVSQAEIWFDEEDGDQVYVGDAQSVNVDEASNDRRVNTFAARGLAGFTDGPGSTEITIDTAVPRHGEAKRFVRVMRKKQDVRIVIQEGDERTEYRGRIQRVRRSYSLDNPAARNIMIDAGVGQPVS